MKVSVITASTGNPHLKECIESVRNQTYKDIEHIVVIDGRSRWDQASPVLYDAAFPRGETSSDQLLVLPYPTGTDRYNGHRIYGAMTFIASGDFFIFLDDDNALEPDHIEKLVDLVKKKNLDWAFSFRKIIDQESKFICLDDCESLGKWASVLNPNDFFVDVNCYFIKKQIAIGMAPVWYRKFREPGQPEIDRVIAGTLMHPNNKLKFDGTQEYTVKYRVGNTGLSVQADFFKNGNDVMLKRYNGVLPWKKD